MTLPSRVLRLTAVMLSMVSKLALCFGTIPFIYSRTVALLILAVLMYVFMYIIHRIIVPRSFVPFY